MKAAEQTAREMDELIAAGYQEHEAWEMVRENYLFPPEEEELKKKWDAEPCASDIPRLHVEMIRAMNKASQEPDDEEPQEETENR